MYPFFQIFWVQIYTFGIALVLCFFLFIWSLKHLSGKFWYNFLFFQSNIVWYFLSVFIFSRLFFVISRWNDMKFIKDPFEFFIMSNYNFSLFWAVFWFFLVLFLNVKLEKSSINKYIDGVVLSCFFILPLWYIGSLLWWQVYGRETLMGIEILYSHPYTLVPYQVPVFPLPIVYSIITFLLFCGLYILSMFIHIRWYIWYIWLLVFWSLVLILEFFSWKFDIVSSLLPFNLNQIFALILVIVAWYNLLNIYRDKLLSSNKDIIV